ncbi:UDP-N-acetylmuramoyl-L-alanine--D-glutamate ligase [Ferruginivarius sediminum]|uniref:UDP-N-acetylmuramoylalanine--D-glutamate ligase n=1 Tax=Ferruginivarius sediminum TaxID=2661937 RepID=A0A369T7H0_9PROT|nr:UDP-N-acetylmuramoyl-L-alanine--D-glutamate ligase [Ferruginivarius sediminum]RDD61289.1 UDP-N-acetylmuramoyl-L-alanine--D-glutamate ligase [Ferruginivarius sediminum]
MIPLSFMNGLVVAVLGLGRSGKSAAKALMASEAEVWAWDDNEDRRAEARAEGIPLVDLNNIDWREPVSLILSPGIPHERPQPHPIAAKAREAGCEIIGDIELLGRAMPDASFIGITGTNGKSTTTSLIGHILALSGREAQLGGNIGKPVLEFSPVEPGHYYVLEMSSYQLERTLSITFDVAVLLNVSPDHLDRHGDLDGYVAAKCNIFRRQSDPRSAIVGVDDEHSRRIHDHLKATGAQVVVPVSCLGRVAGGVGIEDGVLIDDMDGQAVPAIDLREVATLPGRHNWQNAAAAYAACRRIGVDAPVIAACLRSFPGLAHRQEHVAQIGGVAFVNDSKATNAEAAARALACYKPIYWIAGGRAKEGGLAGTEAYYGNVRHAFLIGEAAEDFAASLEDKLPATVCGDLETAVRKAAEHARADGEEGATVLLSPACASFDQFADFEERGDAFRRIVATLRDEIEPAAGTAGGSS